MSSYIDVTFPTRAGMVVWPGDPAIAQETLASLKKGDIANVLRLHLNTHYGTHMDAPLHFIDGGKSIDEFPLHLMHTPVQVLAFAKNADLSAADFEAWEAQHGRLTAGSVILLKTPNTGGTDYTLEPFREDFIALDESAATLLVDRKVALVGIDYLSIAPFADPTPVHRIILGAGIWVIEGLDLREIAAGDYEMICCPLKIRNGDGAPTRVLLRAT